MRYIFFWFVLFHTAISFGQDKIKAQIIDIDSRVPLAYAKVEYLGKTLTTTWEGKFEIAITEYDKPLIIKYKGYQTKNVYISPNQDLVIIKMAIDLNTFEKVEIYTDNKVNKLVKKVIDNKRFNQPEKALESFQYKNYENLLVTANPDSISGKIEPVYKRTLFGKRIIRLDSTNYKFKKMVEKNHLYQTEKVNLIQYNKKGYKETVIATRMAGFKEPLYEYLGLNLFSYSVYENPFEILETPVQNPISNYGRRLYNFYMVDSLNIQNRKTYKVFFQPKKLKSSRLRGLLYIDAETFAIARAYYRIYGIVNINADYTFDYQDKEGLWFPKKRKITVLKGNNVDDIKILGNTIKFSSSLDPTPNTNATDQVYLIIESIPFDIELDKRVTVHNKGIKISIEKDGLKREDSYWKKFAKDTIDKRRLRTYTSLDSLSESKNLERKIFLGKKILNGYYPISIIDLDLRSLVKFNNYEGFRFGLGGVTNDKLSEKYKVAFYGAYGIKDEAFKFGITPSYLLDQTSETWISASYSDDLNEISQITFATDPRRFKIYDPRPINISTFYGNKTTSLFVESNYFPKTETYFALFNSQINPKFDYTFVNNDIEYKTYTITAFQAAIQWNPFSNYMQTPKSRIEIEKRHPKFSFQVTQTVPKMLDNDFVFTKIDFKTFYEIPYLSGQSSSVLLQTGIAFGDVPLTHLYSLQPNNLNRDALLQRITFAGKNSFETMYFNEFFSDKYVSLQLKHTFNRVRLAYRINPEFSFVTRYAWGQINKENTHMGLPFKSLEKGFFESGVECNKLFRGLGVTAFFRYGPNQLPTIEDNIAIKISYFIDLGF
ncbi:MAG: hypothetical protein CMP76_09075 [Flavobacterium sp.]|uniref:DUF5686 family protein n=1 Tax=unclassified Flavobacterium TaxID=196869 RepID=UPI000C62A9A7|nr:MULTISPECIES: DUF5686 family protein [unclassified Flavobacterium]MBF03433.1 hypothetical protein [Flavobacterium sp.]MCO6162000.1 DUF5686 and carboxypeptidase regulatory-like domain-containing protein [Flavobacterium sp. NRK F7]